MSYDDTYNWILFKQWPENDYLTQFCLGLWKFSSQCWSLVLVLISVLVLMFTRLVCAATFFCLFVCLLLFFAAHQSGSSNPGSNLVVTALPPKSNAFTSSHLSQRETNSSSEVQLSSTSIILMAFGKVGTWDQQMVLEKRCIRCEQANISVTFASNNTDCEAVVCSVRSNQIIKLNLIQVNHSQ